jgi:hypothetical protein
MLGPPTTWRWRTKSKEEDVVVACGAAPRRGHGLVLPNTSRMHDLSRLIVATKLRENQTHYHRHLSCLAFSAVGTLHSELNTISLLW